MISLLTLILYPLAIQYKKGGLRYAVLPVTAIAAALDVIANYTELSVLTLDFPRKGEYTFSKRLKRLQYGTPWQQRVAKVIVPYLNYFDPGHVEP